MCLGRARSSCDNLAEEGYRLGQFSLTVFHFGQCCEHFCIAGRGGASLLQNELSLRQLAMSG